MVRFKRGAEATIPAFDIGEPGFTMDTEFLFVGSKDGNIKMAKQKDLDTTNSEVTGARGTYPLLGNRLDNTDTLLADRASDTQGRGINIMYPPAPLVGAKGDGTTNDSSVIQTILNNYSHIYIPQRTYKMSSTVTVTNKTNIVMEGKGIFKPDVNVNMFIFDSITGLIIKDVEFDLSNQSSSSLPDNQNNIALQISNSTDLDIHHVYAHNGCDGIFIQRCERVKFHQNRIENFTWWGIVFGKADGGHLKKAEIYGNITTNVQDGLKFTGILEDVDVHDNVSYGNIQDGFDWAGHSALNVHIHDNIFRNNGMNGVTFKTLDQTTYVRSSDYSAYSYVLKNITIENNKLIENTQDGVYMAYNATDKIQVIKNIQVKNNKVKGLENATPITSHNGIEISVFDTLTSLNDYFSIEDNIIIGTGLFYGIRVIQSNYITVKRNKILSGNSGIYFQRQLGSATYQGSHVKENDIEVNSAGYGVWVDVNNINVFVNNNRIKVPSTTYRLELDGTGITNKLNEIKDYIGTTAPTGRSVKGEIAYSSDPTVSNCMGWVCTVTGSTPTWKTFGAVV